MLLALALCAANARGATSEHPQDGPHVDLRIAIDDDSVRFEVLVNLAFADELVEPARENLDTIHPVEWGALQHGLQKRLTTLNGVSVDGARLTPVLEHFEVYDPDPALAGLFPIYGARALTQIRLDLEYALPASFEEVVIDWRAFPEDTAERRTGVEVPREVLARLSAGGIDSVITFIEGEGPFRWNTSGSGAADHLLPVPPFEPGGSAGFPALFAALMAAAIVCAFAPRLAAKRRLPIAAALAVGAALTLQLRSPSASGGSLTEEDALAVFAPLHRNIYRAFDFTDESDVYDALAQCVEGELLEQLYEQIYTSLVQEEAGGAVGSVQRIEPQRTQVTGIESAADGARFDVAARWQVEGAVFHWGHAHWRVQELAADYSVHTVDGGWCIRAGEITEQILVSATQDRPGEDGPDDFEIPEEL